MSLIFLEAKERERRLIIVGKSQVVVILSIIYNVEIIKVDETSPPFFLFLYSILSYNFKTK